MTKKEFLNYLLERYKDALKNLSENEKSVSFSEDDGTYVCEVNYGWENENRRIHSHGFILGEIDTILSIFRKFGYSIKKLKNGSIKLQKIEVK